MFVDFSDNCGYLQVPIEYNKITVHMLSVFKDSNKASPWKATGGPIGYINFS